MKQEKETRENILKKKCVKCLKTVFGKNILKQYCRIEKKQYLCPAIERNEL
jgi:hypothetical protein